MIKLLNKLSITELNDNDTVGSAFIKGMTNSYVKGVLVAGLVHLGIKAYEQHKNGTSGNEEA